MRTRCEGIVKETKMDTRSTEARGPERLESAGNGHEETITTKGTEADWFRHALRTDADMGNTEQGRLLATIGEVLRGNADAFRSIIIMYTPLVTRLARSFLRNREDVSDAAQEIFFRVYRGLPSFRLDRRFEPWLYSIALNFLRSAYRSKRKHAVEQSKEMNEMVDARTNVPPGDDIDRLMNREIVRDAIARLKPDIREVVVLYYIEDKNVGEIEEILSMGKENIKSKLHRARKKLREYITAKYNPDKDNGV
jgi:RNA polymerase sigma-70 factor (ECF subfamily)